MPCQPSSGASCPDVGTHVGAWLTRGAWLCCHAQPCPWPRPVPWKEMLRLRAACCLLPGIGREEVRGRGNFWWSAFLIAPFLWFNYTWFVLWSSLLKVFLLQEAARDCTAHCGFSLLNFQYFSSLYHSLAVNWLHWIYLLSPARLNECLLARACIHLCPSGTLVSLVSAICPPCAWRHGLEPATQSRLFHSNNHNSSRKSNKNNG